MTAQEDTTALDKLNSALNSGAFQQVRFTLNSTLRPVEVAHLLEKSPQKSAKFFGT